MTDAHSEVQHLTLRYDYPAHEPREGDKHYPAFDAAKRRIKAAGLDVCWICGTREQIELHHDEVEFALANDIDWQAFALDHPLWHLLSEDDFKEKIEMEGNLRCLCREHHRGLTGIHTVHYSAWKSQRWLKAGVAPPERKVPDAR